MPVPCPHPALLSVVPALAPSVGGGTEGLLFLSPTCPVVFSPSLFTWLCKQQGFLLRGANSGSSSPL